MTLGPKPRNHTHRNCSSHCMLAILYLRCGAVVGAAVEEGRGRWVMRT